jgi:hypothetical protein
LVFFCFVKENEDVAEKALHNSQGKFELSQIMETWTNRGLSVFPGGKCRCVNIVTSTLQQYHYHHHIIIIIQIEDSFFNQQHHHHHCTYLSNQPLNEYHTPDYL